MFPYFCVIESLNMMGIEKMYWIVWENYELMEIGANLWCWDTRESTYNERQFSRWQDITVAVCNCPRTSDTHTENS